MMWDAAGQSSPATNLLYAAYTTTVLPGEYLYCSNVAGTCGGSVPLYLYYNAETDDYQLRNDKDTNGTHIRLARGANESNAAVVGKPIQILTDDLAHPNSSKTEDQRPAINKLRTLPDWYNSTNRPSENDRFALPTVTSHLRVAGYGTGTTGTVSMDPKKTEKGESADLIRLYGNGGDLTARDDGNETATKRSREEMSQEGAKDLLGWGSGSIANFGKERTMDHLLGMGKNATGNGSSTNLPKNLGAGGGWGRFTGIVSDGNVSVIDQMKELGKERMEKALGSVEASIDQTKEKALTALGTNAGNNGSATGLMKEHGHGDKVANSTEAKDKKFGGVIHLGSILGGLAGGKAVDAINDRFSSLRNVTLPHGNQTDDDLKEKMKGKLMDKVGNGSEVDEAGNSVVDWKEKMEDNDKYKPIPSNLVNWKETMEEIVKSYDEEKNSSAIVDWKEKMKEKLMDKVGNGSELVKKKWMDTHGHLEKALESLGIDVPSNVSTVDVMKALGKDTHGNDTDLIKEKGKDKKGLIEKALHAFGIDVPSNFSATELMENLGKEDKNKNHTGGRASVFNMMKDIGKDKIGEALASLGIDVPSNFSASDLNLGKDDEDKNHTGGRVSVIELVMDLGKNKIEKALSSLGIDIPSNFSDTEMSKEIGKNNGGGDFLHVLNASLGVLDEKKENRTLHDAVNEKNVVDVEKILGRFNTSLAQVRPSFNDNISSVLIATIPFPGKLGEQELEQARNETAEVKEVRVFDDRLTVYGGDVEAKKDQKDARVENGTWSPEPTGETRGTRMGTEGTRRPSSQHPHGTMVTGANTIGTGGILNDNDIWFFDEHGIWINDDYGSAGSGGSEQRTFPSSSTTSSSGAYTGSSTTTMPYTGPPTTSTTADILPASSSTPYTGPPTTTTTAAPYTGPPTTSTTAAPYTGPSTTADPAASTTTASGSTGIISTLTTVRPTTTTSPYVYAATTDAAGTYGPGDQKLENGTVIRPNGDTIYPNGTVKTGDGAIIEGGKKTDSDGTVHNPDGSTKYPNGTVVYPSDATPVAGSGGGKSGPWNVFHPDHKRIHFGAPYTELVSWIPNFNR
ncbi:hypothetical protein PRIPAC_75290 [Pristionchus pacificus]|nr:hypothetical protein PRIPAC_75290 [Pristionchus pacificus]